MANRITRKRAQTTPAEAPPPGQAQAQPGEVSEGQWQVGSWKGFEMHTCINCRWSTLDGLAVALDYKARCQQCNPRPLPAKSLILLADRRGHPITPDKA